MERFKQNSWYVAILGLITLSSLFLLMAGSYSSILAYKSSRIPSVFAPLGTGAREAGNGLMVLVEQQRELAALFPNGRMWCELGLSELILAGKLGYFSAKGKDMLTAASGHIEKGLALSPVNSMAWARLAYISILLKGPNEEAGKALAMSVSTAPYQYPLVYYRLPYAMMLWQYYNEEEKEVFYRQIRIGWQWAPKEIVAMAGSTNAVTIIMEAFQPYPSLVEEFKLLLEKKATGHSRY